MKVSELKEKLKNHELDTDEQRVSIIRPFVEKYLSKLSVNSLVEYQTITMLESRDYEKFKNGQDEVLLKCLELETSDLGKVVRETLKLEPLNDETVLEF